MGNCLKKSAAGRDQNGQKTALESPMASDEEEVEEEVLVVFFWRPIQFSENMKIVIIPKKDPK